MSVTQGVRVSRGITGVMNLLATTAARVRYGNRFPRMTDPIWIDPTSLKEVPHKRGSCKYWQPSREPYSPVLGGDWDEPRAPLPPRIYIFTQHLKLYERDPAQARLVTRPHFQEAGYTHAATEARLQHLEGVYESVKHEGFHPYSHSRRGLIRALPTRVRGFFIDGVSAIQIAIARNGDCLFVTGQHRLAASLALGLGRVPAVVCRVHRSWVLASMRRPNGQTP